MRANIEEAIASTVTDMIEADIPVSFTQKELNKLGVTVAKVSLQPQQIQHIRKQLNLSQTVFAKLLGVSPSSVRQWEQGQRRPSGATMILLELLDRQPHLLDYRLGESVA